jgi:transcriptional regulator with XRE-family HTH domain
MSNLSHPLSGLRDRRRLAGVTSSAIAARIGVDVNSYGRFERGERRCYLDKAIAIASMLNCTVEQLGHPPSIEERVDMFRAGEKHRELVGQAHGDEDLAGVLGEWASDDTAPSRIVAPVQSQPRPVPASSPLAEELDAIASWAEGLEDVDTGDTNPA